jgi:hypothetical protein
MTRQQLGASQRVARRAGALLAAGGFLVAVAGCHTMRFELVDEPAANVVTERNSFFLWGLIPTADVDVLARCPYGAAAIRERTTFVDGLVSIPTLGFWDPRTTTYFCRAPSRAASNATR